MNNVYDLAHDLARSLKETDQYKNYAAVKARVVDLMLRSGDLVAV